MPKSYQLILFSKPGCHLCEGLQEKLEDIQHSDHYALSFELDIRDITTRPEWFNAYQYEIPVLFWTERSPENRPPQLIPRFSPRASVDVVYSQLKKLLPD